MSGNSNSNTLSRRGFLRSMGDGSESKRELSSLEPQGDPAAQPFPDGKYVDFHVHVGQKWATGRRALSAGQIVQWMDENDISQAVVHPLVNPESLDHLLTNDYVLKQTAPYRDRLIPFAAIDPRQPLNTWGTSNVEMLQKYLDAGAMGFGEHKPGIPIDDPQNMEIYEACAELDLCIMFHLDAYRNTDDIGFPALEKVLQTFPEVTFVGHAPGFWAGISGDMTEDEFSSYPDTEATAGGAVPRLFAEYSNLYGDLSSGSGANAISRDMEFGRQFIIDNADQLLWGTDYLHPDWNARQLRLYPKLDLPEEVQRKVYRDNARELLGLI